MDCPACSSTELEELGQLAGKRWFRCRRCGMDSSPD